MDSYQRIIDSLSAEQWELFKELDDKATWMSTVGAVIGTVLGIIIGRLM